MMKLPLVSLLAGAALLVAAPLGIANAADMALKAPPLPLPPPVYDWTGFYLGVNGGIGEGVAPWQYLFLPGGVPSVPPTLVPAGTAGAFVGGTAGVNWQTGHLVLGLEGDWDASDINSNGGVCPNPAFSCQTTLQSIYTARGRVGYAMDRLLFYATGGFAGARVNVQTVNNGGGPVPPSGTPVNGSASNLAGYTVGFGIEYAIWESLSLKAEGLYYNLSAANFNIDNPTLFFARVSENGELVKFGLNWKFNGWMMPH